MTKQNHPPNQLRSTSRKHSLHPIIPQFASGRGGGKKTEQFPAKASEEIAWNTVCYRLPSSDVPIVQTKAMWVHLKSGSVDERERRSKVFLWESIKRLCFPFNECWCLSPKECGHVHKLPQQTAVEGTEAAYLDSSRIAYFPDRDAIPRLNGRLDRSIVGEKATQKH
jgi:hypothetical protein